MSGRATIAALLALALAAPALAAASEARAPVPVEFSAPARLEGALDAAAGQWALLVFRDAADDAFPVDLAAGGRAVHHTAVQVEGSSVPAFGGPTPDQSLPDPVHGQLGLTPGSWASLYVLADRLDLSADPVTGAIEVAKAGDNVDAHLPDAQSVRTALRAAGHQVDGDGAALALRGDGAPFRVTLHATGVRVLEWHNATLACDGPGACPSSPADGAPRLPGARVLDYVEVAVPGGDLEASSSAFLAAAGGQAVDLAVNGTARLPEAAVDADCDGARCPDPAGGTLLASGLFQMRGVGPSGGSGGRLHADLAGDFGARIDERSVSFGAAAAAAAVAAVAVPVLAKLLLGLFARSARPPALRHPRRRELYDLIRGEPGQSFRGLQRRLGWQNGTLSNHMARLLDARLVVSRRYRNTVRFFDSDGRLEQSWAAAVVLSNPDLRRLHGWLAAHPASPQAAVVAQGEAEWGWKRSTTQDRLRELVECNLAEGRRHGRKVLYSALPDPSLAGAAAGWPQSATVSPSSAGGSFLATSQTPANTSNAAGSTFHWSGASSTK